MRKNRFWLLTGLLAGVLAPMTRAHGWLGVVNPQSVLRDPQSAIGKQTSSRKTTRMGPIMKPILVSVPSTAQGGQSFNCTVTLDGAPSQDQPVNMTYSPTNAPLHNPPSTVTVPANSTGVTFSIQTNTVSSNTSVTITASCNGGQAQGSLTVTS